MKTSAATPQPPAAPTADIVFLALKGLAAVAGIAIVAAVIYAAAMAARYWPSITV